MTLQNQKDERKHSWKYYTIVIILMIVYIIFLVQFYNILRKLGSSFPLAILILVFAFLIFLGIIFKAKDIPLLFKSKRKKNKYLEKKDKFLEEYEKYRPYSRRVDYVNLNLKYRKKIIHKCPNCGIILASFVKKCPNCGEKIVS
ncbi:MAG: zinc ribbon domain-containing protein [Promethearchaeota archaeon]